MSAFHPDDLEHLPASTQLWIRLRERAGQPIDCLGGEADGQLSRDAMERSVKLHDAIERERKNPTKFITGG